MATRAEQLKRLKQGEEAKKRVMDRINNPVSTTPQKKLSRYEVLRQSNYVVPNSPANRKAYIQSQLPEGVVIPDAFTDYQNFKDLKKAQQLVQSQALKQSASDMYKNLAGFNGKENIVSPESPLTGFKPPSEYEYRKNEIANTDAPGVVKAIAQGTNWLMTGNPVGAFFDRIGKGAAQTMGYTPPDADKYTPATTGSKVLDKTADIGGMVASAFTPMGGAPGTGLVSGPLQATEQALLTRSGQLANSALTKGLSKVVKPSTAQGLSREIGLGLGTGVIGNPAFSLATGQDSGGELLQSALIGGGIGAPLGAAGYGLGKGVSALFKRNGIPESEVAEILELSQEPDKTLALPRYKGDPGLSSTGGILELPQGRGDLRKSVAAQRSNIQVGTDPIVNPYTFGLPRSSRQSVQKAKNFKQGVEELLNIGDELSDIQTRYEQAVIDEYKWLKESRDTRPGKKGGITQGGMTFDNEGNVITRFGRSSDNPQWYRDYYAEHGRVPSNKEMYRLARERVDNGFNSEVGYVPGREFKEELDVFSDVRSELRNSLKEINPALQKTDAQLKTQRLKDLRRPTQPKQQPLNDIQQPLQPVEQSLNDIQQPPKPIEPKLKDIRQSPILQSAEKKLKDIKPSKQPIERTATVNKLDEAVKEQFITRKAVTVDDISIDPKANKILYEHQFDEGNVLGISAFNRNRAYDSLSTDTRSQLVSRQYREPKSLTGIADKTYTRLVDNVHPMQNLDKAVENLLGEPIPANASMHKLALSSRGSDVITKQIITDQFVDKFGNALVDESGKVVGKSLKDVLSELPKKKDLYVDFEDYLVNKHAITRYAREEKVYKDSLEWTPEKGAQKIREYEQKFPQFKEISEKLYEFQRNMVNKWLVDTGVFTPKQAQAYFDANPHYVPNIRFFTEMEKMNKGIGKAKKGFGNQTNPTKKYGKVGSQRPIISPIETIIENVDAFVKTAKRNEVMQTLYKRLLKFPDELNGFAEIVDNPEGANIMKYIKDGKDINEIIDDIAQDYDKLFQRTKLDKDNIVRVLVDGEPVYIRINDREFLNAITTLGPKNANWFMDGLGKVTNIMKATTTGANPVFSFTRSLMRDIPQAYIASKTTNNPIYFAADLISAAIDIGSKRGAYKQFLSVGGGHSSPIAADRNLLAQSKRAVIPQKNNLKAGAQKAYNSFENVLNYVETAPRLAEFKRTAKQTGDLKEALYRAQEVTTNFKRKGSLVNELDTIFPYFNAAIQGMDQVARVYKDNPVQALTKTALAISLPTMALYALNYDNPDYQKMSNRTKDAFYLIPKGDGKFIKIAKPQEQGTIFSDLPERLMRMFYEQDPDAFKDFADRLRTTMLPPGISGALKEKGIDKVALGIGGDTILGPFADVAANKKFSGAPVVPGYLQNLSPELQTDANTTSLSTWLGEKTKTSPKVLDYLIRQYSGVISQLGQPLLTPGGSVGGTLTQQVTADPVFSNDISTEFYTYKDKLDQANNDKGSRELPEWYDNELRKQLNKISSQMSDIRKEIRGVQSDTNMNKADKRNKLRELQEQINKLAESGNELARGKVPY